MKFRGEIKEGKLVLSETNRDALAAAIKKLEGCQVVFELNKWRPVRSGEQNKLYWSILTDIERESGQEKESLHEFFKSEFLKDYSEKFGKIKSTTELNTIEFMEYITKILKRAAEFGIVVTMPGDEI